MLIAYLNIENRERGIAQLCMNTPMWSFLFYYDFFFMKDREHLPNFSKTFDSWNQNERWTMLKKIPVFKL